MDPTRNPEKIPSLMKKEERMKEESSLSQGLTVEEGGDEARGG